MTFTALIVDDSKLARMVTRRLLISIKPDWEVREASGADEALALAREGSTDIALLDFNMAGMNGIELAVALRVDRPNLAIYRFEAVPLTAAAGL